MRSTLAIMVRSQSYFSILAAVGLSAMSTTAHAGYPDRVGTRAMSMGGALRAAATGDAGPMLNPSGMSLLRSYAVEGSYQYNQAENEQKAHRGHFSVVDSSTSSLGVAAGLYYTYLSSDLSRNHSKSGHEIGAALSLPFGDSVLFGVTAKYFNMSEEFQLATPGMNLPGGDMNAAAAGGSNATAGLTFDVGATVRPLDSLGLAVVGQNLIETEEELASALLGFGAAFTPIPTLLITGDAVLDFESKQDAQGKDDTRTSIMFGAEYLTSLQVALRAGGGHDGVREARYFSLGAGAVSKSGALEAGFQRDVSGTQKLSIFSVSARIFVQTQ